MILAVSEAVKKDFGLIVTFGGIGVLVMVLLMFIAVQIRGERHQNQQYNDRTPDR